VLDFQNPQNGNTITDTSLPISGVIDSKNGGFTGWRLEYGVGNDPNDWTVLTQGNNSFPEPGLIYTWDLTSVTDPQVTLRLYLMNGDEYFAEKRVTINLSPPTPTPTATPLPTEVPPTALPTDTPVPTAVTPTETFTPFPTPMTPIPSETPTTGP